MSACHCCLARASREPEQPTHVSRGRTALFNKVTALLVIGWVSIVAIAIEMAGPADGRSLPAADLSVELFIRSLF